MTMQRKLALRPFHLRIRDRVENACEKGFAFCGGLRVDRGGGQGPRHRDG